MGSPSSPERSAESAGKSGIGRTTEAHLERIGYVLRLHPTVISGRDAAMESLTAIRERFRELTQRAERAEASAEEDHRQIVALTKALSVPSPASQREDVDGPKA